MTLQVLAQLDAWVDEAKASGYTGKARSDAMEAAMGSSAGRGGRKGGGEGRGGNVHLQEMTVRAEAVRQALASLPERK